MTTYRDDTIRGIVLRNIRAVRGEQSMRYAQVVGVLTALLDDDAEMVAAIKAACREPEKEEQG